MLATPQVPTARFHDFGPNADNSYYGADPRGVVPEDIFRRMKDLGVRYVFGRVNTGTDKKFAEFLKIGGTDMVKKVDMSKKDSESASMPSNLSLASQVVKYRSCKLLSQKNRLVLNLDFNLIMIMFIFETLHVVGLHMTFLRFSWLPKKIIGE